MKHLYLFGTPQLIDAQGEPIPFASRNVGYLLAYLWIQRGRPQTRERLAGLFWPDSTEEAARSNLRTTLYHLRQALEFGNERADDVLGIDDRSVRWRNDAPLWVDVADFKHTLREAETDDAQTRIEQLKRAVGLVEGPFCEGCYADWCLQEQSHLNELYRQALDGLITEHSSSGNIDQAIRYANAFLGEDPLDEAVHRQLMYLYSVSGQRNQALLQYSQCIQTLERELGVSPTQETEGLRDRILNDEIPVASSPTRDPGLKETLERDVNTPLRSYARSRIAVLPFADRSSGSQHEHIADGMTEELIFNLSKVQGLRVIAQTSVMAYKNSSRSISTISQELKVGTVLEGSVRVSDGHLRVTIQLVDALTDEHLWSEQYDREFADIFRVQSDIAQSVVDSLNVAQFRDEQACIQEPPTQNLEAYHLYLKGRHFWNKRTKGAIQTGLQYFNEALDVDPTYANAYLGISGAFMALGVYHAPPPSDVFVKARSAAQRALELDPQLAGARAAWAFAKWLNLDDDMITMDEHFRDAIRSDPSSVNARNWYANYLMGLGRFGEAEAQLREAQKLDPLAYGSHMLIGGLYHFKRECERGVYEMQRILEFQPNNFLAHWALGLNLTDCGRYSGAIEALQTALDIAPTNVHAERALGWAYAISGKHGQARAILNELEGQADAVQLVLSGIGMIHTALGEFDEAFHWLNQAVEQRDHWMMFANVEPRLDPLRDDSRFDDMIESLGLAY